MIISLALVSATSVLSFGMSQCGNVIYTVSNVKKKTKKKTLTIHDGGISQHKFTLGL